MALNIDPMAILAKAIEEANLIGLKIKASKSDTTEAAQAVVETSDDALCVKYREGREKALAQMAQIQENLNAATEKVTAHAQTLVQTVEEGFDVEAATKDFLAKRKVAHAAKTALLSFVDEATLAAAMSEAGIAEVIDLRGTGTKRNGSGGAVGIKRPRISAATLNGEAVYSDKENTKVDFTGLAKASKSHAETLKAAAFVAAKTEDLNSLAAGTVVSFEVGDNKFTVTVSGEKPGRKPAEKVEETVEETVEEAPAA